MQEMKKDKWVDEVINSIDGMEQAMPPSGLFAQIEQRVAKGVTYARTIPMRTVMMAAASVALLAVLNIAMLTKAPAKKTNPADNVDQVIEYYGLNEDGLNF